MLILRSMIEIEAREFFMSRLLDLKTKMRVAGSIGFGVGRKSTPWLGIDIK